MADKKKHEDQNGARRLGRMSIWVSVSGFFFGFCMFISIAIGVSVNARKY
jgi:hypothetical protein